MDGWGKLVAGAVIGVVGTVYATNEEFRRQLPEKARDLPPILRKRFATAVVAAREASARRRAEILQDLETHGGEPSGRSLVHDPSAGIEAGVPITEDPITEEPEITEDLTEPIPSNNEEEVKS